MDTMTIAFQDKTMISVMRSLIDSMRGVTVLRITSDVDAAKQKAIASDCNYQLSPRIKSMETGCSLPDDVSDNYKCEIAEIRNKKYL